MQAVSLRPGAAHIPYFTGDASSGAGFTPLSQDRLYDSRDSTKIPAGTTRTIQATGNAGIPSDKVSAVAMTVLAMNWTQTGSAVVYNPDVGSSNTSSVSFKGGGPAATGASSTSIVEVSAAAISMRMPGGDDENEPKKH